MFFKCKHPADRLVVEKEQTIRPIVKSVGFYSDIDPDFEQVNYHLICRKCGQNVTISHAKTIHGVDAFLSKKI